MSLKNLGIDYIDLYLMHLPVGIKFDSDDELFPTDASGKIETKWVAQWLQEINFYFKINCFQYF